MRRREFIRLLGATAAWPLGAVTCGSVQPVRLLAAPVKPPLRVDIHCHLFNGHDLPMYGLLESVFVEQEIFGLLAEPLALWLAYSIEGNSPTYKDECNDLNNLIVNPGATAESNSGRVAEFLERGLEKFIKGSTSCGHQQSFVPEHNDAFLLELLRRFGPPSAFKENMTKDDVFDWFNQQQFRQELIRRILEYKTKKRVSGIFDEISEYISQFSHWVGTATEYHSKLADDLSGKFGESVPGEMRVMTPAIIDFGPWPDKSWYCDKVRTPDVQAILIEKIALIRRNGRVVHGFIGFDPWRYLQEKGNPNNSLEVVKNAVNQRGFVGVKLYPPMGFQPYGNAKLPNSYFPSELVHLCKGRPGHELDRVLAELYKYCDDNELAIMAHCSDSIGSRPDYALRSAPELWNPVLDCFKKLRLNLGHFGGIWDYVCDPKCDFWCRWKKKKDSDWPNRIAKMVKQHDNLFVDVADFSGVLERWPSETCLTNEIFEKLKHLVKSPKLRSRMMYGSDWMLLDREPQNEHYYQSMQEKFSDLVGPTDLDKFLGKNAAAFLGLKNGQKTRKRIDAFYRDNHQQPPDFDRYLLP
jgi:predicted TIM-barrel fold metal-dependent hydrolase